MKATHQTEHTQAAYELTRHCDSMGALGRTTTLAPTPSDSFEPGSDWAPVLGKFASLLISLAPVVPFSPLFLGRVRDPTKIDYRKKGILWNPYSNLST